MRPFTYIKFLYIIERISIALMNDAVYHVVSVDVVANVDQITFVTLKVPRLPHYTYISVPNC